MYWRTLLRRNLRYHRRGNFAVILGIAVGTAALVGALLVGDSLRGSLRERAKQRLGSVDQILIANSPFDSQAALRLMQNLQVTPVLLERGAVELIDSNGEVLRRSNNATLVGTALPPSLIMDGISEVPSDCPNVFIRWFNWGLHKVGLGKSSQRIINETEARILERAEHSSLMSHDLAKELNAGEGAQIRMRTIKRGQIKNETALGRKAGPGLFQIREEKKTHVLDADDPLNRFSFDPGLGPIRAVYWRETNDEGILEFNAIIPNGSVPTTQQLRDNLELQDYGLSVGALVQKMQKIANVVQYKKQEAERARALQLVGEAKFLNPTYFPLESRSLILDGSTVTAALAAAESLHLRAEPTLVYLANGISDGTHEIPYSVIAALNPQAVAPLGPFLDPKEPPLADDEILLADWAESPLTAKPGDKITVRYFLPESEGKATEATATFRLRAKVSMTGVAADPFLTPEFPGITDKLTLGDWDPPFPYDPKRITQRDEAYWNKYRGTPKVYVNLAVGQKLFGSRFGVATSVRIAPKSPETIEADAKAFEAALKERLNPADFGFVFRDVRKQALEAAEGSVNFSGLFLGFSLFLIVAALLLVALLVRLNLDRRASEVGLWLAVGFTVRGVRRLLLAEGLALSVIGALLGLILAVGYAALMLHLLAAMWPEGQIGSFLELHVTGMSLAVGFVAAVVVSCITIALALRSLVRVSAPALLRGVTTQDLGARRASKGTPRLRFGLTSSILLVVAIASIAVGPFLHEAEAQAGAFFTGGAALLAVGLIVLRRWLRSDGSTSSPDVSVMTLGIRNASRNPTRSLLTAGLLASAAFLLVAVESFRRSPGADFATRSGGSGGFALIGSMDLPLYQDPEDLATGRQEILDALEKQFQKEPETKSKRLAEATKLIKDSRLIPLRVQAGDEAGCRNLNKPTTPRLFGVPNRLIDRGGFQFASTLAKSPEEKANPWLLLRNRDGEVPVFGEANTVKWMLGKSLGDTLEFTDGRGQPVKLRIVGLFQDSIFQGELVMAESELLKLYPTIEGYPTLLAEAPPNKAEELRTLLEAAYADRGIAVERSADRLQSYLAIENTYLSTFQILGGFGLLLGACGLGVVLMRSAWERRGELALLQAVGFRRRDLGRMVFSENLVLLAAGLGIGVFAALAAVLPQQFFGQPTSIPWMRLFGLLVGVAAMGVVAGMLALRPVLRAPIVAALRGE